MLQKDFNYKTFCKETKIKFEKRSYLKVSCFSWTELQTRGAHVHFTLSQTAFGNLNAIWKFLTLSYYYYYFLKYSMETLDHAIIIPGSVYPTSLCRKIIWILRLAHADGGNRTRPASAASDRAIHYTIVPRLLTLSYFWQERCFRRAVI